MTKEVAAIFAIGPNDIIGIKDKMPWHSKQDFYHFKKITKGYPCLFGATTFHGLPKYPLVDRLNVVLDNTKSDTISANFGYSDINTSCRGGYVTINDFDCALDFCANFEKIFICGGASIYKYVLENNKVNTLYITRIISPELQREFNNNEKEYVKFPVDLHTYLSKDWVRVPFEYKTNELPEENDNITVQFQKWIKI